MASVNKVEIFNAPIDKVYKVLANFASYPDFMDGVKKVEVLSSDSKKAKVKYHLDIIKSFTYVLDLTLKENETISWVFESGDLFKKNDGKWSLKDLGGGKTEVTYSLDLDFKILVPGMISKKLASSNLPSLMKAVEERAKAL